MSRPNRLTNKTADRDFTAAVSALLDGEALDWKRFDESRRGNPAPWQALQILESIRNIYEGDSPLNFGGGSNSSSFVRLQILDEIGAGSFGRVCRARDRVLDRDVAVKIIPANRENAGRLFQEVRALAKVEHPGVVRIYHVSKDKESIYIEMELVRGERLDHLLSKRGKVDYTEAAAIGAQAADALEAIHREGLIHGDVKPANLMRRADGRIVLLDFGLARFISLQNEASGVLPKGTPMVMAPEQLTPGEAVGPRADLYALSVILYWLASGRYPCEASTLAEMGERVRAGRIAPLGDICKDADRRFVEIVMRGLSTRPADRFGSAGEFAAALREAAGLQKRTPLLCETNVFVTRGGGDFRLHSGSTIKIGDRISAEVTLDGEASIYIFNESKAGEFYLLFPLPGMEPKNPLSSGTHRLPGRRGRTALQWTVNSAGGGEERIIIVATRKPIIDIDELVKNARPASETADVIYPKLTSGPQLALMRGLGGLTAAEEDVDAADARGGRLRALAERLDRTAGGSGDLWCRLITLKNAAF